MVEATMPVHSCADEPLLCLIEYTWLVGCCMGFVMVAFCHTSRPLAARLMSVPQIYNLKYTFGHTAFDWQTVVFISTHMTWVNILSHVFTFFTDSTLWLLLAIKCSEVLFWIVFALQLVQAFTYMYKRMWVLLLVVYAWYIGQACFIRLYLLDATEDWDKTYIYLWLMVMTLMRTGTHGLEPLPPFVANEDTFACQLTMCCGEGQNCLLGAVAGIISMGFGVFQEWFVPFPCRLPIVIIWRMLGRYLDNEAFTDFQEQGHRIFHAGIKSVPWYYQIARECDWYESDKPMNKWRWVFLLEAFVLVASALITNAFVQDRAYLFGDDQGTLEALTLGNTLLLVGFGFIQYLAILSNPDTETGALSLRYLQEALLVADIGLLFMAATRTNWRFGFDDGFGEWDDFMMMWVWLFTIYRCIYLVWLDPLVEHKYDPLPDDELRTIAEKAIQKGEARKWCCVCDNGCFGDGAFGAEEKRAAELAVAQGKEDPGTAIDM